MENSTVQNQFFQTASNNSDVQNVINPAVNEIRKKIKQALLIGILIVLILSGVVAAFLVAVSAQVNVITRTFTFIFNLIFHLAVALILIWDEKNNILNSRFQALMITIFFSVIVNFFNFSIPIFFEEYKYMGSVFISLVTTVGLVSVLEFIYRVLGKSMYVDVSLYSTSFFLILSYFMVLPLYFEPDIILQVFNRYGNVLLALLILMSVSTFSAVVLYRIYLNKNPQASQEKMFTSDVQLLISLAIVIFVFVFCITSSIVAF